MPARNSAGNRTASNGRSAATLRGQTSNQILQSGPMTVAPWNSANLTLTGSQTDPFSGTNATLLTEQADGGNSNHYLGQTGVSFPVAGAPVMVSFYAKAGSRNFAGFRAGTGALTLTWNLTTLAVNVISGASVVLASGAQDVGGGWVRCFVAYQSYGATDVLRFYVCNVNSSLTYLGTLGTNAMTIFGAMVEPSAWGQTLPSDYAATTSAAVTLQRALPTARRSAFSTFTPSSIGSCVSWLRADLGLQMFGSGVAQWTDQSARGANAVQATPALRPTLTASAINGQPALTFDGSTQYMTIPGIDIKEPMSVFIVAKFTGTTAQQNVRALIDGRNVNNRIEMRGSYTSPAAYNVQIVGTAANAVLINLYSMDANTSYIGVYNGASSAFYLNNGALSNTGTTANASLRDGATIGARYDAFSGSVWLGHIAEIAVFASALTAGERANLQAYSVARYGV